MIDAAKAELGEEWNKTTKDMVTKLGIQELRMQAIELRHNKVIDFEKRFVDF